MKEETKIIDPGSLLETYRTLLQEEKNAERLPLLISGDSMGPFLRHGRDTVYLSRLTRPARRGDILLYQRDNGAYVLHRVYGVTPRGLTMVGDAQTLLEEGIRPEQVIAVVVQVNRNGRELGPGALLWDFFEKIWIRLVPLRPVLRRVGFRLKSLFGK